MRNWATSESEWSPQGHSAGPETSPEAEEGVLGGWRWLWLTECAKTLTAETPGKYNYYY